MTCARCDALARENAELREEVAAWRGHEDDLRKGEAVAERIRRLRGVLPMTGSHAVGAAKLLLVMIDRPGQVVGRERLLGVVASDPQAPPEMKALSVYMCFARKAVAGGGFGNPIETVWGQGYRFAPQEAHELRARMGETA